MNLWLRNYRQHSQRNEGVKEKDEKEIRDEKENPPPVQFCFHEWLYTTAKCKAKIGL